MVRVPRGKVSKSRAEQKHTGELLACRAHRTVWEGEEQEGWIAATLLGLQPAGEVHLMFGEVGR